MRQREWMRQREEAGCSGGTAHIEHPLSEDDVEFFRGLGTPMVVFDGGFVCGVTADELVELTR